MRESDLPILGAIFMPTTVQMNTAKDMKAGDDNEHT